MATRSVSLASVFLVLAGVVGIAWGVRLWAKPEMYNPNSILHRQLYLFSVSWLGKKLDEGWRLERQEVRKAGMVITLLGVVVLVFAALSLFP